MIPALIILFITVIYFLYAMRWGIVKLLAGAIGLGSGLTVFFIFANIGPEIIDKAGFGSPWQAVLVGAGILGMVTYFIVWAITGFILRFIFNPDSFLHPLVAGIPGGVMSLFASFVMAFFLISVVRIAGTYFELKYVATIAQPEIEQADLEKLPEPSFLTEWRNQIEKWPKVADLLDKCDPFSRRENRNFGLVTLWSASQPAREFSEGSSQMGNILSNSMVVDWVDSQDVADLLELKEYVGLVLGSDTLELAALPELNSRLKNMKSDRHIDDFIQYVKTNKTPVLPQ